MMDKRERPFTQETKRLLIAMISDLQPTAAQQALYALAEALTRTPRIHKDDFQEIIDDARSYNKLINR